MILSIIKLNKLRAIAWKFAEVNWIQRFISTQTGFLKARQSNSIFAKFVATP